MSDAGIVSAAALPDAPVVILVQPQLGENIGMVARAMLNCGATRLRLVAPRDGWPNPAAVAASSGADSLLEQALVFSTVQEAVADVSLLLATTAQYRAQVKPVYDMPDAVQRMVQHQGQGGVAAILFGPERTGLDNDTISLADALLTIPLNPAFSSLNLAQAVLLVCYQWRMAVLGAKPAYLESGSALPVRRESLHYFLGRLETALDEAGFFTPPEKKPHMLRNLQNIFVRAGITEQEVQTLHGVLTALRDGAGPGAVN